MLRARDSLFVLALALSIAATGLIGGCGGAKGSGAKPPPVKLGGCATGLTSCGGKCVNIMTGAANCGSCTNACPTGQMCANGHCTMPPACTGSQMMCNGACTDTTSDPANCGTCGTQCMTGMVCQAGTCAAMGCPPGQLTCMNGCVDPMSDAANCGGCGMACAAGQQCTAGACAMPGMCAMGQMMCGGACTDVTSDAKNCGACGTACTASQTCTAGKCVAGTMMGGMAGCAATLSCLANCTTQACQMTCANNATAKATMLLNALITCLQTNCPDTNGGVCDSTAMNFNQTACQMCVQSANGGKCMSQVQACSMDTGGGGTTCPSGQMDCGMGCTDITMDANNCGACGAACNTGETCSAGMCSGGNANGMLGCSGTVNCLNNCGATDQMCQSNCVNQSTDQGYMILMMLFQCLDSACPSTNGGVCDSTSPNYSDMACSSCFDKAQNTGGKCAAAWNACAADTP